MIKNPNMFSSLLINTLINTFSVGIHVNNIALLCKKSEFVNRNRSLLINYYFKIKKKTISNEKERVRD